MYSTSLELTHERLELSTVKKHSTVLTQTSSVLRNPETRKALDTFVKSAGNTRGATLRATQFIEQEVSGVEVPEDVVRNAMDKLRFDEDDAHKFFERLRAEKRSGKSV